MMGWGWIRKMNRWTLLRCYVQDKKHLRMGHTRSKKERKGLHWKNEECFLRSKELSTPRLKYKNKKEV